MHEQAVDKTVLMCFCLQNCGRWTVGGDCVNYARRALLTALYTPILLMSVGANAGAEPRRVPLHRCAIVLFDGHELNHFDIFLKSSGLNSDPTRVFRVERGALHISGKEVGYIITKESYREFYLRAEFKWGVGTYGTRAGKTRDSGILYNVQGEPKVWPQSIEFQITEGGTGDFWTTDGAALTETDGKRVEASSGSALKIDHVGKGPSQDVVGFRDSVGDLEKPHGKWNVLELVAHGDDVKHYVNGKLANEGKDPFPAAGKILIQSEGAEVFFRKIKLYPLK